MRKTSRRIPLACVALALAATVTLSGCTGANLGVSNNPGSFSLGGQTSGTSDTKSYDWQNPSTRAEIQFGGQAASGSFKVTIKDATGREVHSITFSSANEGYSQRTDSGTPGTWKIVIDFRDFTGNVGLNINAA